jgi:TIGR02453 family protein
MFNESTPAFLKQLARNNNKTWFDAHRPAYAAAKNEFEDFVSRVISALAVVDNDVKDLEVKDCTFRLNRDIRFSKDKTPYKVNMGASFNRGGKKSIFAGYYFHLEPGGKSFAGGGLWMPMAPELRKIRQEIDYCFEEFQKIITDKKFKAQYKILENTPDIKLSNVPRGYDKENEAAEFLKLKSFLATKNISDKELLQPSLLRETVKSFSALMPLIKFLNKALEG